MDLKMPVLNGLEATIQIRKKENQTVPIVALSAAIGGIELEKKCLDAPTRVFEGNVWWLNKVRAASDLSGKAGSDQGGVSFFDMGF
jgi:CheY-like chemotaxis protein